MSKSIKTFWRWVNSIKTTWALQVFQRNIDELNQMVWANESASKLVYNSLGDNGAKWTDGAPVTLKFAESIGEVLTAGKNVPGSVLLFKHYI